MTLYRVDLVQTVIEETTVYIEANSEEDAATRGLDKAMHDASEVRWDFCDAKDDPEVIAVAPVQRPDLEEKWNKGAAAIADALRP